MRKAEEPDNQRSNGKEMETTVSFDGSVPGPGATIGPFRIERELGRGAMGIVYLAHDTRLNRPVAIKSLPAELLENDKVRTLFKREARVLASLNHPNIATIYEELQEAEGVGYLVLEYIPGQTLREHTSRAKLKPQEAMSIALQIADAVAAAHEHEVIHRDLKPGNIKITPDGRIKVLDFGLAKALGAQTADQQSTVTEPGRIMGTPAYMSPEQARGQEADERCDIWSFGCVLYEMLTGKVPFKGDTVSDTLANILNREPDWHALPRATPANIQVLLRRCLEKDRRRRLHDIVDASLEISETLSGVLETVTLPGHAAPAPRLFRRNVILVALVCSIAGMLIAGSIFEFLRRRSPPGPPDVSRLAILVPSDELFTGSSPNSFLAISADGRCLIYVGKLDDGTPQLFRRSIRDLHVKPIPGTIGAHNPFFSPDGRQVGFFTDNQLKIVALAGGPPLTLHEGIPNGEAAFGSWAEDGTIVFSAYSGHRCIQRIRAKRGQQAEILVPPVSKDNKAYYCYPQVLPGGKAILYSHIDPNLSHSSHIEAYLPNTGKSQVVLEDASYARYVKSGHLIFVRDKALMVAPFDLEQLKPGRGIPFAMDDVGFDWDRKTPQITVSKNGTIAYILGSELPKRELVWVNLEGEYQPLEADANVYEGPCLSSDGRHIAVGIRSQEDRNIRISVYDVQRERFRPLTTEGESSYPQWSPNDANIAFWGWTNGSGDKGVFRKVVGPTATAERLTSEPSPEVYLHPYSWSKNLLACTAKDPNTLEDIWVVDTTGQQEPTYIRRTGYREYNPALSPDCNWLAYVSDESGQPEVYLQEYPAGKTWPVTTHGAASPVWSRDGKKLYYISSNSMMIAVEVTSESDVPMGAPVPLFTLPEAIESHSRWLLRSYDVSGDERFLMLKRSDAAWHQLIVVQNWFDELPPGRNE